LASAQLLFGTTFRWVYSGDLGCELELWHSPNNLSIISTYYCSDDRTFQANYDFGACSCALAAGPTLSLSLPRPRRLADVTPTVCTLGTDNRAHDSAVQMRQHLQSFLTGSVAALAFGYYRVHQDVWYAAEAVQQRR
jgi:hypothetical protein